MVQYTALLNFEKLGWGVRAIMIFDSKARKLLEKHPNVNNLHLLSGDMLFCDAVFRDMKRLYDFKEKTMPVSTHFVLETIKFG